MDGEGKLFMDNRPEKIERQINDWFDNEAGTAGEIVKTETVVTAVTEPPDEGTYPCIVVTIWYEPPSN